ncbi:MAG: FtsW/RodA/SpoVE family cell cycle protein, partial [Proteobacteria bacterium]|nr:FtsW/RodA/SpoVE family cell cycle protein [Pseudomonadota bacterium]
GVAQRGFLPEAHTDFIGAVVGEELGGIGWTFMILAYVFIIWRGTLIAQRAQDLFGILLASGVTSLLAIQAIINLGVIGGLLPPKGLVLPFLSYGASAVLVHTIAVALLLRVSRGVGRG